MAKGNPVTLGGRLIEMGERTVGSGTVALISDGKSRPCSRVWVGAPSTKHTKAAANTTPLLIGNSSTSNASGGMFLDTADSKGFFIPIEDASLLYVTGFTADDRIEFQIYS